MDTSDSPKTNTGHVYQNVFNSSQSYDIIECRLLSVGVYYQHRLWWPFIYLNTFGRSISLVVSIQSLDAELLDSTDNQTSLELFSGSLRFHL